jgi:hypothetical protein
MQVPPAPVVVDAVVVFDPVVLGPAPPLPPLLSVEVPAVAPLVPHPAATANIETTIAPSTRNFMRILGE